jgi:hypothetical protein
MGGAHGMSGANSIISRSFSPGLFRRRGWRYSRVMDGS